MKKLSLFSVLALLLFVASCKKSDPINDEASTSKKTTYSFSPKEATTLNSLLEEAIFQVTIASGTSNDAPYAYVRLVAGNAPGGAVLADKEMGGQVKVHQFSLAAGTIFHVETTSSTGTVYISQTIEAGVVGAVTINVPN